jgi:hypothetical protein
MTNNANQAQLEPQGRRASKVQVGQRDLVDLLVRLERLERLDLPVRVVRLEQRALQEVQGLQDLVVRLETVVVNAKQHWYLKTTLLHWMIIILGLIILDRLLLHFPTIVAIVNKLL